MPRRIAIIGVGQTKHTFARPDQPYYGIVFEAARAALDDAGLERGDIDTVVTSSWDVTDGRTISDMYVAPASGSYLKDASKTSDDGIMALVYAYLRLASGSFDTALVTGFGHREGPFQLASNLSFDPFWHRPLGVSQLTTLAIQAAAYAHRHKVTPEQVAPYVVQSRKNGVANAYAHLRRSVRLDAVLSSPPVATPLRALDLPPQSVGAVALVLASDSAIRRLARRIAWIEGIGWAVESYHLGSADLASQPALEAAAQRAYKMAGVRRPDRDVSAAEVHDLTSYHALMACEALGLARPGKGASLFQDGTAGIAGRLPVNPSGGTLCTNLHSGSGLLRAAEAALQVMDCAGRHQAPNARRVVAHGASAISGAAAQSHCVVVLRKE